MTHTTIKELPQTERPYEKALHYGVRVLSDAELLAVILRSGTKEKTSVELARDVLTMPGRYQGLLGLYHAGEPELMKIHGIGRVKALELLCVAELARRMARMEHASSGMEFRRPAQIADFFMAEMRMYEREHFYVALFDASCHLLKYEDLFQGTNHTSIVSPREALRLALRYDAFGMVVLHNHPSGDPTPSPADDDTTTRFYEACETMGIVLYDHIIIGDNTYISYMECGFFEKNNKNNNTYQSRKEP